MKRRLAIILSVTALVAMCALIFMMSAQPAVSSAETSSGIAEIVARLIVPGFDSLGMAEKEHWLAILDHPVRKAAHLSEFALLGMLSLNAIIQLCRNTKGRLASLRTQALSAWAFASCYGASDEIHQLFVPGRAGRLSDVAIDSAGALIGVVLLALAVHLFRRRLTSGHPDFV